MIQLVLKSVSSSRDLCKPHLKLHYLDLCINALLISALKFYELMHGKIIVGVTMVSISLAVTR